MDLTNWAGNCGYRALTLHRPTTLEQVQEIVASAPRLRALGSRHSFTDIGDSAELLTLDGLPADLLAKQPDDDFAIRERGVVVRDFAQARLGIGGQVSGGAVLIENLRCVHGRTDRWAGRAFVDDGADGSARQAQCFRKLGLRGERPLHGGRRRAFAVRGSNPARSRVTNVPLGRWAPFSRCADHVGGPWLPAHFRSFY